MKNKEDLEKFLKSYNFWLNGNTGIVFTQTEDYIKLELGGHWITKEYIKNPSDADYVKLFNTFFKFICGVACKNIPDYKEV